MFNRNEVAHEVHSPVAISDKELSTATSFTLQTFELCTMCGARFGIGYHGDCLSQERGEVETELPRRLTEILAKDHRQERAHKHFIDLDF